MATLLKRELSPLTDAAWHEVDAAATQILRGKLSGRSFVDVDGPHGYDLCAVNLGRLNTDAPLKAGKPVSAVPRRVLPLVEIRVPCSMPMSELEAVSRGANDIDAGPVEDAAGILATYEEHLIYDAGADDGMAGILTAATHKPIALKSDVDGYVKAIADAYLAIKGAGINGPYTLIAGSEAYAPLTQIAGGGKPLARVVEQLIDGSVRWSPVLGDRAVLVSTRGDDFKLTVGQDIAIGYERHDAESVELVLIETLAFQVFEPKAAVPLKLG
jgi:uncharacterized linocin/CFP29 family protein